MMIDRTARTELSEAISAYLNDRLTAFEFDEAISEIAMRTKDATVEHMRRELWCFYDDCKDHPVVLTKQEWDYFQRLRLILDAGLELNVEQQRESWTILNKVAAGAVASFCLLLWGFDLSYCLLVVPFGIVSMLLAGLRRRNAVYPGKAEIALLPFESFGQIRQALVSTSQFRKQRYRSALAERKIRNAVESAFLAVQRHVAWLLAAPLVLAFQAIPDVGTKGRVTV